MSWFYRHVVRPVLFNYDSEQIHDITMNSLGWFSRQGWGPALLKSFYGIASLPLKLWDVHFPNPIGLAAGMDKHAAAIPAWAALGFGFSELGGVTWHSQPGNEPPRLFRAISDEGLVNRMGFNNSGAAAVAEKLAWWRNSGLWPAHPVGMNLGKSKITPLENAADDYAQSFRLLRPYADFFVVNVSSPNTPNLRQLQDKEALDQILYVLQRINFDGQLPARPLLVKVAPDLSFDALDDILDLINPRNLAGIVATNTTISRPQRSSDPLQQRIYSESGGLSGRPLRSRSTEVIRHIFQQTRGRVPIVGVGGIFNAADAWEKLLAGASLVQVYTGLVYEGPSIAADIAAGLAERLEQAGCSSLEQFFALREELRKDPTMQGVAWNVR